MIGKASSDAHDVFAVILHDDGRQPWAVGFRLTPLSLPPSGGWRPVEFLVQQLYKDHRDEMTSRVLRSLPLGAMIATASRAADSVVTVAEDRGEHFASKADAESLDWLLRPWRESRRGKGARGDEDYAALAVAYALLVQDGDRTPAATLAARMRGVTTARSMVSRVAEARKRGLLTAARSGEAGGAATAKAWQLVRLPDHLLN